MIVHIPCSCASSYKHTRLVTSPNVCKCNTNHDMVVWLSTHIIWQVSEWGIWLISGVPSRTVTRAAVQSFMNETQVDCCLPRSLRSRSVWTTRSPDENQQRNVRTTRAILRLLSLELDGKRDNIFEFVFHTSQRENVHSSLSKNYQFT